MGFSTRPARNSPPPLWVRTDSGEARARRGAPGTGLPVEAGPPRHQPQGQTQAIRQAQAPAADRLESLVSKVPHARRPLLARLGPPHKGEEERPQRSGRGVGRLALGGCGTYRAGLMHPESPSPTRMPWGFVAALSFAQLVSWGI